MSTRFGGTALRNNGVARRDVAHAVVVGLMRRADLSENEGSAGRRRSSIREAMVVRIGMGMQWQILQLLSA